MNNCSRCQVQQDIRDMTLADDMAVDYLKKKYGMFWKFRCGEDERLELGFKFVKGRTDAK